MFKFFRKIRQRLLTENKFSKYLLYAIGEIILVVIGILIALSINNWNQNHIDKKNEQILLKQLFKDFEANDSILKNGLTNYQRLLKYQNVILRNTGPNATVPEDRLVLDSVNDLNYPKMDLVYSTLNVSSQQIDKLSNAELKLTLSKFPSLFYSYEEVENQIKNLTIKQRQVHQKYVSLINEYSGYEQEKFKSDVLGYLRDREFQNITVDNKWSFNAAFIEIERLTNQNRMILNLIEEQIEEN